MVPKENSWSIVILGLWNRMIFSPDWVGRNVFDSESVECLVSVMPQEPTIFRKDGISLFVQDQRLTLKVDKCTLESLISAEQKALKTIKQLPHTPLIAIGFNFAFVIDDVSSNNYVLDIFNHDDDAQLTQMEWDIEKRIVERQLTKKSDIEYILKYTMVLDSNVSFAANYHHPVKNSTEAEKILNHRIEILYNEFIHVLSTLYGLNPDIPRKE